MGNKITEFTDLIAWQKGHELVLNVYRIIKAFPEDEKFALVNQMQRSSTSITSNIAEGFGRYTYKERARFYHIASGSTSELKNQIMISRDLKYINQDEARELLNLSHDVHRLLRGLIKSTKTMDTKL